MAIGWITAFKAIPWGDVIAAAPTVAQGAKKLWTAVSKGNPGTGVGVDAGPQPGDAESRLRELEAGISELKRESAAASELIKSLAGQNSRLVDAVEILRLRTRALLTICFFLVMFSSGLAIWLLWR
ncbi:MAG: hypothetical protein AABZ67_08695 [Pseudomonadota bacterium]